MTQSRDAAAERSPGRERSERTPGRLQARAPAKINLGLFVGPQRGDGRHELVSVMQSISLADTVGIEFAAAGVSADQLSCDVPELAASENLVLRALSLYRARFDWDAPPLELSLHKRVPIAAGLGGGSGDAAAMLRLLEALDGRRPAEGQDAGLMEIAAQLGADVPAQLRPGRWLACGVGDVLRQLPRPAGPCGVLVLALNARLSTAEVYGCFDRLGTHRSEQELGELAQELSAALSDGSPLPAAELLENDLQAAAVSLCPQIAPALELAKELGAERALLSGSGPTVLGLYTGPDGLERSREAAERLNSRIETSAGRAAADARPSAIRWARSASFVAEDFGSVGAPA